MIFIGLNTGTSVDAVDCIACEISDNNHQFIDGLSIDMPVDVRSMVIQAVESQRLEVDQVEQIRFYLTNVYIQAAKALMQKLGLKPHQVHALGLHGQTIHHKPNAPYPYTMQLGDASRLADALGISVVDRFRDADIACGGQGAPLIPCYHQYLLRMAEVTSSVFINLGGIANTTVINNGKVKGWDIGPANALMDLWCEKIRNQPFDDRGQWARSGEVVQPLLQKWMSDAYFELAHPKSTGRDYFSWEWLNRNDILSHRPEDIQATLCELTALSIQRDLHLHADSEARHGIYVYGKGIENTFLMERLQQLMPAYPLKSCMDLGIEAQWLESGLFAWLAYCHTKKLAIDLTQVTGSKKPAILGSCCHAAI